MPRLDLWLVETGRFTSRQAAKRAIKDGLVLVNEKKCKPSKQVSEKDTIELMSHDADFPLGFNISSATLRCMNIILADIDYSRL